ncbi:MAG: hypothetical protein AB7N76_31935 [Planctomycetota bacterium]
MVGLPPYKPFENDRVKWVPPKSEVGGPVLAPRAKEDFSFRQPAMLVFLGHGDGASCCAANYERIVFMDQKVVELTKTVLTLRIDRGATEPKVLERYEVKKDRPAILVLDCEGEVHARFDFCTNARDVLKALLSCLKASKTKVSLAKKVQKLLDEAQDELKKPDCRRGAQLLRRVLGVKGAPSAGAERATRILGELEQEGAKLIAEALALERPTARYDRLLFLRHELWDFDALVGRIRPVLKQLEEGEQTKELIWDHKGQLRIDEALALIAKGGKDVGVGRSMLHKVRTEYAGSAAGKRAEAELAKGR